MIPGNFSARYAFSKEAVLYVLRVLAILTQVLLMISSFSDSQKGQGSLLLGMAFVSVPFAFYLFVRFLITSCKEICDGSYRKEHGGKPEANFKCLLVSTVFFPVIVVLWFASAFVGCLHLVQPLTRYTIFGRSRSLKKEALIASEFVGTKI